jgi:uncharacterized protein (UPF0262 family)
MTVSFAKDILPLFRAIDIAHMKPHDVLLDDYSYMSAPDTSHQNATDVYDYLSGAQKPRMPIGGPYWTDTQLSLYSQWMSDGYLP